MSGSLPYFLGVRPLRPELPAAVEGFVVEHGRAAPNRARWRLAAMLLRCLDAALMLRWFGTEHQGVRRLLNLDPPRKYSRMVEKSSEPV
jgi:hypothetical protein